LTGEGKGRGCKHQWLSALPLPAGFPFQESRNRSQKKKRKKKEEREGEEAIKLLQQREETREGKGGEGSHGFKDCGLRSDFWTTKERKDRG